MRIWSLFPAVVCVCILALAGESPVNFSGTWVLDKSKSKPARQMGGGGYPGRGDRGGGYPGGGGRGGGFPGGGRGRRGSGGGGGEGGNPVPRDLDTTLVMEQTPKELRLVRKFEVNGEERSTTQVFNLEGETSTNPILMGRGEYKTRSSWEKDKLVTLGTQTVSTRNGQMDQTIKEEFSLSKDGKELTMKTTRTTARGKATSKMVYRKQ